MNREEILAKSRQENSSRDPYELEVNKKASELGAISAIIICAVLYTAEIFICGSNNYGLWSIAAAVNAGTYLYSGIKLGKKRRIVIGIIWAIVMVVNIVSAITNLINSSTIL